MPSTLSLRPFIGAKDFATSRNFYRDFGFAETLISPDMMLFSREGLAFYLQEAYVKDWLDNTMLFLEVDELEEEHRHILSLQLPKKYPGVRISAIKKEVWGAEFFVHDPSGILWHIGTFATEGN